MASTMWRRDLGSSAKQASQGCMDRTWCKWPLIAGCIIAGLVLISFVWCIVRCCCCGAGCCCGSCCQRRKKSTPPPPPPPQAPINQGYQFGPKPPQYTPPAFATFDAHPKPHEDQLPSFPTLSGATSKKVEDTSPLPAEPHKNDVEMSNLKPAASTRKKPVPTSLPPSDLQFKPPRRKGTPYRTPHEDDDFHDPRRQPSQRVNGPYSPGGGQYDRPPPLPRDPYSRSPSTRPDPYARSASAQSDPYARSPSAQPDPYSDPYASPQRGYNRTPGPSQSYSRPTPGPFLPPGALPQHTHPSIQQQQARSFSPSPQLGAAGYIHSPTSPAPLLQHHQVPTPPPQAQYRQRPETVYDSPFENPPTTAATPQQLYQPYSPTLPQEPAYKRSEYVEMPGSAPAPVPVHRGEGVVMELDAGPVPARGARPPSALTPGMRRAGNGHAF